MELVPTPEDVLGLLRAAGALRSGHFLCPSGFHTNQYLETALTIRQYRHAKTLSVGLSRLLRANPELRAMSHDPSVIGGRRRRLPLSGVWPYDNSGPPSGTGNVPSVPVFNMTHLPGIDPSPGL